MSRTELRTIPLAAQTRLLARLTLAVTVALARRRDRRILSRLDAHLLRDIGLDARDAQAEAAKPFWQD